MGDLGRREYTIQYILLLKEPINLIIIILFSLLGEDG